MTKVSTILTGGTVVTMNDNYDVFVDGAVAIQDSQIVAIGPSADIRAEYTADEIIPCDGKYILPGLINAHTHAPMTLLRGLADDLRLDVWLMGYIMPTEREFVSPEFCRLGTKLACAEMIMGGVTTFADMYYFEDDIAETTEQAGMRALLGQTILKFPAPDAESYEGSLEAARAFVEKWHQHERITPSVAPHAPYSSTKDMLKLCAQLAMQYDVPIIIHISESAQEEEDNFAEHGLRVVPWLKTTGLLNAKVLAAHCVHINKSDMATLYEHDVTVSHNPQANLKLANGVAPVSDMLENHLTVGIGTDGPASNNDLDMFEEMRTAALLAKSFTNNPTALPARQALTMATRDGARALFMGDKTGSLEAGKYADIITMQASTVHNWPHFQRDENAIYSQIVYAGKSSDVESVMCHGRWLMRDRQLQTLDLSKIMGQAHDFAQKVDDFLSSHENDVVSKLLAVGGLERAESFEVQMKARIDDADLVQKLLDHPDVEVLKRMNYRQYDTYFTFDDHDMGRVRYREDDRIDERGEVSEVRARLTFTMPTKERVFNSAVLLSHSRFIAPADRPLRFYQEYFQGADVQVLEKERQRWHIHYQGVLYYINIDSLTEPKMRDMFIEIKSRTWSLLDAQHKADGISRMMDILDLPQGAAVRQDYLEMTPS
ncbi:MAG: amidohydrolase [Anaerolineaceae bacterium]|nr:MAG: amidohydrolase [Anaerolineaceae bacterium]